MSNDNAWATVAAKLNLLFNNAREKKTNAISSGAFNIWSVNAMCTFLQEFVYCSSIASAMTFTSVAFTVAFFLAHFISSSM